VADPLAGSYYVEDLCKNLEIRAKEIISRIDSNGGVLKAIESGFISREIQSAAFTAQKAIDSGAQKIVGLNCYTADEVTNKKLHRLNPKVAKDQLVRLKKFKAKRKSAVIEKSFKKLEFEAQKLLRGENAEVCESILEAVENRCTLGEIADILRSVAGVYRGV
jgi:methylmalonyl-CoA mutase N-terminal domain/subunit